MAQYPFASLDLSDKYIVHDVTLYAHGHATQPDGINAAVKAVETALKAFDIDAYVAGGGAGDMTKAVYDTDNDGIVDGAEALNDGTNTVTAAALRDHLDNHPSGGDTVGGYVEIATSRVLLAAELQGHLILATGGCAISLPDTLTLPDNARCDILTDASLITVQAYSGGKGLGDRIYAPGIETALGGSLTSSGILNDVLSLRKGPAGWYAIHNTGFAIGE